MKVITSFQISWQPSDAQLGFRSVPLRTQNLEPRIATEI